MHVPTVDQILEPASLSPLPVSLFLCRALVSPREGLFFVSNNEFSIPQVA